MNGGHDGTSRPATDRGFKRGKLCGVSARGYLDVARLGVPHPARNAEFHRPVADEPAKPDALHLSHDPEVNDGHLATG